MKTISYLILALVSLSFAFGTSQAQTADTVISISSIGVNASVVESLFSQEIHTWDVSNLAMTVGHLEYTAWFGQAGNILLAGHSEDLNGAAEIFYNLDDVQLGDEIIVTSAGTNYRYIVSRVTNVSLTNLSILQATELETLTLFTCDISSYANGVYTRRHVVVAERSY